MAEQMETRQLHGWRGVSDGAVPDDREDRLLPWRSVRDIAGISRTTAWRMQQSGDFPNPVTISANRVGWWESDLTAWKAKRRVVQLPRPKPFPSRAPKAKPPQQSDHRPVAAEVRTVVGTPQRREADVERPQVKRRGRSRPVSPDQIDFGF